MSVRQGRVPNTIEQITEHGSLIQSYETPLAVFVTDHSSGRLFFYSKECKPPHQKKVSNTTRKHLRTYQTFYAGVSTPIPLEHTELVALYEMLQESYKYTAKQVDDHILGLCQLYVEN